MFNPMMIPGMVQAGAGILGLFGKNRNKNPADVANATLGQIPGQVNPYYQPYINTGTNELSRLTGEYQGLTDNPGDVYNQLGSGYKESPGYQFALQQALQAQTNQAAKGGMLGTPMDQQQSMEVASGMAAKDYENYINHILGLHSKGLEGEQGLQTQGYDATNKYADLLSSVLGQQAANSYSGQAGKNQANNTNWSNLFGGMNSLFGNIGG
jgi:hypothetical protein